jgi:hypothetical protein
MKALLSIIAHSGARYPPLNSLKQAALKLSA